MVKAVAAIALGVCLLFALPAEADRAEESVALRFMAAELGGVRSPRFLFKGELHLLSQVERWLGQGERSDEQHAFRLKAAEAHVASEILATLETRDSLSAVDVASRANRLRTGLELVAGGAPALAVTLIDSSVSPEELDVVLRRFARAQHALEGLGLSDRLAETDLERMFRRKQTPFREGSYESVRQDLRAWADYRSLHQSLRAYFRKVKNRVDIVWVETANNTQR